MKSTGCYCHFRENIHAIFDYTAVEESTLFLQLIKRSNVSPVIVYFKMDVVLCGAVQKYLLLFAGANMLYVHWKSDLL